LAKLIFSKAFEAVYTYSKEASSAAYGWRVSMTKPVSVSLPESLKIAQVHALHDEFDSLLDKTESDEIVIRAGAVNVTDTAGLQLVVALIKTAKERHMTISWDGVSDGFRDAARTLGLQTVLELN